MSLEHVMSQAPMLEFERLAKGLYLEGLAVDHARDIVWYSDVIAGGIFGLKRDGEVIALNRDRMWTGGIMMNADGSVLSSGADGIMWNNPDSAASGMLIAEIDGQPIPGVNEMMPDGEGGIYFGTIDLVSIMAGQPTRPAALYRLTVDRELICLAGDLGLVNGMMLSADRRRFFCNETFDATYVYDVGADLGLTGRRRLLDKEDCDGMALDAEGNLWVTGFRSSHLERIGADGTRLDPIEVPAGAITQIRFGGADMREFYLTCVPADGGDNLAIGVLPTEPDSFLLRGRSAVAGMPIAPARFDFG